MRTTLSDPLIRAPALSEQTVKGFVLLSRYVLRGGGSTILRATVGRRAHEPSNDYDWVAWLIFLTRFLGVDACWPSVLELLLTELVGQLDPNQTDLFPDLLLNVPDFGL